MEIKNELNCDYILNKNLCNLGKHEILKDIYCINNPNCQYRKMKQQVIENTLKKCPNCGEEYLNANGCDLYDELIEAKQNIETLTKLSKEEFIEIYNKLTYTQITEKYGLSTNRISSLAKQLGLEKKKGPKFKGPLVE